MKWRLLPYHYISLDCDNEEVEGDGKGYWRTVMGEGDGEEKQ